MANSRADGVDERADHRAVIYFLEQAPNGAIEGWYMASGWPFVSKTTAWPFLMTL